jgi:Sec-independent protein translocase protein TatA
MLKGRLTNKGNKILFLSLIVIVAILLVSCDKAKETMDDAQKTVEETADKAGEVTKDAVEKVEETTEKVVDSVATTDEKAAEKVENVVTEKPLLGVWQGKLDSRLTILSITSQEGNNFSGKITINYRNPINQEVKGTLNPETKALTMADQIHSRFKGKYSGKLSEDGKTYSGTFTTLVDKNSVSFNLVKK